MHGLTFDVAHLLAGGLVLVSFMLLYQDRLQALVNVYALHAVVLSASVAWQAYVQDAAHLYITAAIAQLREHPVTKKTLDEAHRWSREAVEALAPLPEGPVKKALTRFAETIVERSK